MAQRCSATAKSTGKPCGRWAIDGGSTCPMHGSSAPQVKAKAAQRVAEEKAAAKMRLFAAPVDIDPANALLELVQWTAGEVRYWRAEVARIAEAEAEKLTWSQTSHEEGTTPGAEGGYFDKDVTEAVPHVAYRMLTDAQDRLAKYAAAALRAGVEERRVRLAEDQGAAVAGVIRKILERLDLLEWQAEMVSTIVPEELRALTAGV
ncbi:hypothetical protein [Brachybacterium sp.]|uniref:hypothetical protein n=1 Tax=Brachybacterium sp. TaxID=1891286 RepID=UPI002ED5851D